MAQEEKARAKDVKEGDRVRGKFSGRIGIVRGVYPSGFRVMFEGERSLVRSGPEWRGAMLHPALHLLHADGREFDGLP